MIKKYSKLLLITMIAVFASISNCFAKELTLDEVNKEVLKIDSNASYFYNIGQYIFTSDHVLELQDTMLSARTIEMSTNDSADQGTMYNEMATYQFNALYNDDFEVDGFEYVTNFTGTTKPNETLDICYINYVNICDESEETRQQTNLIGTPNILSLDGVSDNVLRVESNASYFYNIGQYIFTSARVLKIEDMMLAARTIEVSENAGETNKDAIYDEMTTYQFNAVYDDDYNIVGYSYKSNFTGITSVPQNFNIKYVDYQLIEDKKTYEVVFEDENSTSTINVSEGQTVEAIEPTLKEGYTFDGWYTADGNKFDFTTVITEDIVLTAKWTKTICTVSFTGMDNTSEFTDVSMNCGETLSSVATPTSIDRGEFVNWYLYGQVFDITTPIEDDIRILARFEKDFIHTITFHDGENILIELLQSVEEGNTATKPEAPEKEGYTFIDWFTDKGNLFDFTTKIMGDLDLYADYKINTYSVKFYSYDEELTDLTTTIEYGNKISKPTMEDSSTEKFTGWYMDEELTTLYNFDTLVTEDVKLYAGWVPTVLIVSDEATLKDALADPNIKAIELTDNVTLTSPVIIDKAFEIYGHGNSIRADYTSDITSVITIDNSSNVIMNDVVIDANLKGRGIRVNSGKLTFEDSSVINGKSTSYASGIYMTGKSELEFINSTVSGNMVDDEYATDNYMQYSSDLWIGSEAKGTITSGTIGNVFVNANSYGTGNLVINGGTISNVYLEYGDGNSSTLTYTNGTINTLYVSTTNSNGDANEINNPSIGTYTSGDTN